jgi:iron complex transport system permease protein
VELAVHCGFRVFADSDAALRELPALAADAATQHKTPIVIGHDDTYVGAVSLTVYPIVAHGKRYLKTSLPEILHHSDALSCLWCTVSLISLCDHASIQELNLSRARTATLFAALLALVVISMLAALASGSADIGALNSLKALYGDAPDTVTALVIDLRLPRALTAFAVGGLLAVAGVLMQVLLRNPLAEPYILGTSGGAAVAALLAMLAGFSSYLVDLSAFGGAMAATVLVFSIAHGTGSWTPTRLLLTGVVLAAGFSAITTLLLALSPDQNLRGMLFWLMGDLSYSYEPTRVLLLLLLLVIAGLLFARHLNVLARGELQAAIVGLPVVSFRYLIFTASALATSFAVTTVGVIGFIGLVVPHLVRLLAGSDHRIVLPASALLGGSLLLIADTLARTVLAPRQLPVGALTAAIGVPLFLLLISRSQGYRNQ